MPASRSTVVFVSGTDTNIGKSTVSLALCHAALVQGLTVAYYKPIQTGAPSSAHLPADTAFLRSYLPELPIYNSYCLPLPAAPSLAATHAGQCIELDRITQQAQALEGQYELLIVEGAGGLYVPWSEEPLCTMAHLALSLSAKLLLVSANRLGTINHTGLSLFYAQRLGVDVLGFCFARQAGNALVPDTVSLVRDSNADAIVACSGARYLGEFPELSERYLAESLDTASCLLHSILKQSDS